MHIYNSFLYVNSQSKCKVNSQSKCNFWVSPRKVCQSKCNF